MLNIPQTAAEADEKNENKKKLCAQNQANSIVVSGNGLSACF